MNIKIEFLQKSDFEAEYYNKIKNWFMNSNSIPLDLSIVGNMYMKKINEGMFNEKEIVDDLEIKFFKLVSFENETLTYNEIILDKVETDEKQLKLW
jgi:hypothetical protein